MAWNNDINFRHYQDFDDMYHSLLDEIINGGVQYQDSTDGTVENLHITCDSFNCTLQPRDVLFKPITRWKYLCSRYLDFDEWRLFKKGLESKKIPQSRTFRFKEGNVEILGDDVKRVKNGPCLLTMTLSFNNGAPSHQYNRVDIVFRNSQIETKLLFDLILVNRMLEELSQYECVNIKKVNFHMLTAFVSCHYLAALMALNKDPKSFFGDDTDFIPNESIVKFTKNRLGVPIDQLQYKEDFNYQSFRRYYKYYEVGGNLAPLKLVKFEKLRHDEIFKIKQKFIKIDYDYLHLDGTYGKIEDVIKTKNVVKHSHKKSLW